jgi:hypothetical protein
MEVGLSALEQTLAFNELETLLINQKFMGSELLAARITKIDIIDLSEKVVAGLEGDARMKAEASVPGMCSWEVVDL